MRDGWCWERRTLGLRTGATGSGWLLPTPTAGDASGSGSRNKPGSKAHSGTSLTDAAIGDRGTGRAKGGGLLNPTWVEWLMGWPLRWTDLEPLEMGKFQSWLLLHGK
jgi:hypothetical protein